MWNGASLFSVFGVYLCIHTCADLFVSLDKSKCATMTERENVKWCITTFGDKGAELTWIPCFAVVFCKRTESYYLASNIRLKYGFVRWGRLWIFDPRLCENIPSWWWAWLASQYIYLKYLPSCQRQVLSLCSDIHSKSCIKHHGWMVAGHPVYIYILWWLGFDNNAKDVVTVLNGKNYSRWQWMTIDRSFCLWWNIGNMKTGIRIGW